MIDPAPTKTPPNADPANKDVRDRSVKKLGKGLDVGTANLVCAFHGDDGKVTLRRERNAFIDVKIDAFTRAMLNEQKVSYASYKNLFLILGQTSYEFANIVGREVRRTMQSGLISSKDADALPVLKLLIEKVLGAPQQEGEPLCFSLPAAPVDSTLNIEYHRGILIGLLNRFGYQAFAIDEGMAVVYSELAQDGFTGIGASFGGGMVNLCVAYKSMPALSFSITRCGDWIDQNAAQALGIKATRANGLRERGVNIKAPKTREEEAIAIFYRNLIAYVASTLREHLMASDLALEFPQPIPMVCAGGTSLAQGFAEVFMEEFDRTGFPVPLKEVRVSAHPLDATARGCLVAANSMAPGAEK
jgi:hypothetical protein